MKEHTFEIHSKSETQEFLSIQQIFENNPDGGSNQVYKICDKYIQFKITSFKENDDDSIMIQMIDISSDVQHNQLKSQNELLSLINATISHELRNPLNSMQAQ